MLKNFLAPSSFIARLTKDDFYRNPTLIDTLLNNPPESFLLDNDLKKSFEKEYSSEYQRLRDEEERAEHSETKKKMEELSEIQKHNVALVNEYNYGEEGIDRFHYQQDRRMADVRKMKKDVRAELNEIRARDPATARAISDYLFKEQEFEKRLEIADPDSLIKTYPGGPKGPLPEDDPEHYSEWFVRNQPNDVIYGKGVVPDYRDIGVKYRFITSKASKDEDDMVIERKDNINDFLEANEAYPGQEYQENYKGVPEFDIAEFENYNSASGRLPFLRFHTHLKRDEVLPLPDQHTLNYQNIHWELERWTLFNQLPNLYKFDKGVR